jgi:hypothetical protein
MQCVPSVSESSVVIREWAFGHRVTPFGARGTGVEAKRVSSNRSLFLRTHHDERVATCSRLSLILLFTMDVIHSCLELVPVLYLSRAFSVFQFIWSSVQQVKASRRQLETLALKLRLPSPS